MNTLESLHSSDKVVEEHRKKVAGIKKQIVDELIAIGHAVDPDVKMIDGKYAGLFVLPSPNHLYIGFGSLGGHEAYRGNEAQFDAHAAAHRISDYVRTQ